MKQVTVRKTIMADVAGALEWGKVPKGMETQAEEIMESAIKSADLCWTGTVDGKVGCIWGLQYQNICLGHVYLWLFVTKIAEENEFRFVRSSKLFVEELQKQFRFINGHVAPKQFRSIRWLKWLGFQFGPQLENGTRPFWIGER